MKKNITDLFKLFILVNLLILALMSMPERASASNAHIIWKHQGCGDTLDVDMTYQRP